MASDLDAVVQNEGELTLRKIVEATQNNEDWHSISGIAYRVEGEVRINPSSELVQDLDSLPTPARDLMPMDMYFNLDLPMGIVSRRSPWVNMITSRGCPAKCAFCSSTRFWGHCYRVRKPELVLDEMEELVSRWGVKEIKFFDDNLAAHLGRAKEIFRGMIDRKIDVAWNTPNGIGIHNLDYETIDLMKRSGCYELTLAVESGDPYVLKNIVHKPFNLDRAVEVAKILRRMKLGTYGFFIIGFPGETKEQIHHTISFAKKLNLDRISVFVANPLPGTEIFDVAMRNGYISEDFPFEEADYLNARFDTPQWSGKWVERTRKWFFWTYNLSLPFRDPVRFLRTYWPVLRQRPLSTAKLVMSRLLAG
jgi:magnesium-protoporphyrin IX monomethyl ester (oxidative) cyclase